MLVCLELHRRCERHSSGSSGAPVGSQRLESSTKRSRHFVDLNFRRKSCVAAKTATAAAAAAIVAHTFLLASLASCA